MATDLTRCLGSDAIRAELDRTATRLHERLDAHEGECAERALTVESRLSRLESRVDVLTWLAGGILAGVGALLLQAFGVGA